MTTIVDFKMETSLKNEMEKVCKSMGLTIDSAFNVFAKKLVMEKKIPFEIVSDPFYSTSNLKELNKRIKSVKSGKSKLKSHKLVEVE